MSRRILLRRLFAACAVAALLIGLAGYFVILWPLREKHPALRLAHGSIAVQGATIYVSPDRPPLHNSTLLARDGRIVAIGGAEVAIPDVRAFADVRATVRSGRVLWQSGQMKPILAHS